MAIAEGRIFEFQDESHIRADYLETIEYDGNAQEITYVTDEFNAVCPFSGLPDFARVTVQYVPTNKLVELKSLKYYFISYRSVGIYQEAATNRVYNDLWALLSPRSLMVTTVYNVRGGIVATCVMDSAKMNDREPRP